ncbi:MAG: hypothetical protein ISR82_00140 [Candidatus Marinimicrobia bacterium]|nr:hypothetical protein [Candidatus Neomarinimicrobiota bacterium]MBL7009612.1 hypothetical protein [Candidatus Neomarinimicrobiota bacterium]MBL7029645.1 hypothetical protein [Candidatus Neomarinimicrobiota bacterium]
MSFTKKKIINAIENYLKGAVYSDYYVGITANIGARLFGDHGISTDHDIWIYREAITVSDAREIEKYFLDRGIDGGPGGGDENSKKVYVYKKTSMSNP